MNACFSGSSIVRLKIMSKNIKSKVSREKTGGSSVALQSPERLKELQEVSLPAGSSEADHNRAPQFRAMEGKTQGSGQFFLEESYPNLSEKIRDFMAIDHQCSLGMDLHTLGFESVSLPPFHHDGQIQGNFPQGMIHDLVCLPGFHPKEITVSHVRVHVRLEVAPGYLPAGGERQGQKTGSPEENIVSGYCVLGQVDGHFVGPLRNDPNGFEG